MKKKNHVRKQGIAALLAAAVTIGGLPNGYVYAMPGQPVEALGAETEPDTALPAEDAPVYRLVKKGEPSASGYQAMVWVDEAGNEVEGMSFYDEPAPYRVREALPSRYNMADQEELPAVRNQGKWGTCWAHAAIASVETNMVKKGLANATGVDYSERHLSYFAHRRNEALGDGEDSPSEGYGWYGGGNYYQALAAFSNWNGAASEEVYPYVSNGDMADLVESDRMSSVSHVTDASFLNTAEDVKRAVMETGAVMCSFYTGDGTVNSAQEFVYHAEKYNVDHSVNIVGWDDDYDKTAFDDNGRNPAQNGAWLCRNSWGSEWNSKGKDWGKNGYFWISYEDATLGEFCSFQAEGADNYDNIYSYDGAVTLASIGYDKSANIFRADQAEELKAVSFIANKNYDYRIEIYADRDGAMQVPSDGALVCSQEGSLSYPGYHTIPLENSVILDAGMKYAVAVQFISKKEGETAGSYLETTEWGGKYSSEPGQSFFYAGGRWQATEDLNEKWKNVCVKAFTDDIESVDRLKLTSLIKRAEGLAESDYTVKSWEALQAALDAARQAVDESLTDSEMIRVLLDLQSAIASLVVSEVFISSESELENFSKEVGSGNDYEGQTVLLLNDLDMARITHTMIGNSVTPFQGTFDGGGHAISNLTYSYDYSYGGLFGNVGESGTVKNVRLIDADMTFGHIYSGSIAGFNKGTVSGCEVIGNLAVKHSHSGGIVGWNEGEVSDCRIQGDIMFANSESGGIVGWNEGVVSGCEFSGTAKLNADSGRIGGAIGMNNGTAEAVSVNGTVIFKNQQKQDYFVGGIVGSNNGTILKCSMEGEIVCDSLASVGGIVGYSDQGSTVKMCRNLAKISGNPSSDARTAGIGVCLYGEIYGCYNYGKLSRSEGKVTAAVYCYLGEASVFSNCYYLDTSCGQGGYNVPLSNAGMTRADFTSGKAAYYLNSKGETEENAYEWSQKDGLPIPADDSNPAVVKVTVEQESGNQYPVTVNGVSDGTFYANGGSMAELSFGNARPEPGYQLIAEAMAMGRPLPESGDGFALPKEDAAITVSGKKRLISYEITYHLNGGSGEMPASYNVETSVTFPEPKKGDIAFLGWYDNSRFEGEPVTGIPVGTTGNKEYWAKWDIPTYEVRFPQKMAYEVVMADGIDNEAIYEGDSCRFTVRVKDGYDGSGLLVKRGGITLEASGGEYCIENVDSDIDVTIEGVKLAKGKYEVENVNGYVGATAVIRPVLPASKIKLESGGAFADSLTVDTDREISIVVCDDDGTCGDPETIIFKRDTEPPVISSAIVEAAGGDNHMTGVYITVTASDEKSGELEYSFDGGETWQKREWQLVTCKKEDSPFEGTILVRDGLGNQAEYKGQQLIIPGAGKWASWVQLFVEETSYLYGESFILMAAVAYEDAGEEAEVCGQVKFLTSDGEELGTADVTAEETDDGSEFGIAYIVVSPAEYRSSGEKKFKAEFINVQEKYQNSVSEEISVTIEKIPIAAPVFGDVEVEAGTISAAGVKELGETVFPTSDKFSVAGTDITYEIVWDADQTIDLTASGSSVEFTGSLFFPDAPEWAQLPESMIVSRKVTVGQPPKQEDPGSGEENPPANPPEDTQPDQNPENLPEEKEPEFKKGAEAVSKNGRYQVIDAKKKTAALVAAIDKKATKFEVPDTVKICGQKCKVVEIKANVFKGGSKLKKLTLGKNVAKIGKNAFSNCKKLNSIQLKGKALKSVGKGAFSKTASKITVKTKKLTKKQKDALKKALRKGGISSKVKI